MQPQPSEHHRWLAQFVGEWTCKASCDCGPDMPPTESTFHETVTQIGELWIVCEGRGEVPDGEGGVVQIHSKTLLGYDPAKERYVGSYIANMMTYLWHYEGTREGDTVTLDTLGPHWSEPKTLIDYQDIYELVSPDERRMRSQMKTESDDWYAFMHATYTRA